jgi:hypothetical protein
MQQSEAIQILQCLVDGIDPHTGEELPINNPIRHLKTVRALRLALKAMQGVDITSFVSQEAAEIDADTTMRSAVSARKKVLPARNGESWAQQEDEELAEQYDNGMTIEEIAVKHGRTSGAIRSRLLRLGRMP